RLVAGELWVDAPPSERGELSYRVGDVLVYAVEAGLSIRQAGDGARLYVARGLATATAPGGRAEVHAGEAASIPNAGKPRVEPVAFWEDWTGGMADNPILGSLAGEGSGQIFGVDRQAPAGTPAERLEIARQAVRVVLRAGLAETEVDQTFFNPTERAVEGWYWFKVPEGASVTGFALETNGVLVEGELIERQEAAAQYERAAGSGHAPALLEWIDSRTFRARIFPVPAIGTRRVVLRYLQLLPANGGQLRYLYPLQAVEPVRIGEFSLSVDLGEEGRGMSLTTLADARVEDGGRRVSMRRSGFVPRCDFQLEARQARKREPLRLLRFTAGQDAADYVMARYVPDVEWHKVKQPRGEIVLVVDTSAGGDDGSRSLKAATAQAILRALSAEDRFALVALDVRPSVLYPADGLAAASEENVAAALKLLAEHVSGGATDLSALFDVALERLHGAEQPAVIYVGDGLPTSGELGNAALIAQLRRALATSRARLFTVGAGPQANRSLLQALASAGGGEAFQVNEPRAATERALRMVAELKTPTLTDFGLELGAGLDEVFDNIHGKLKSGDEVIVLARTHHDLPARIKAHGRLGGQAFSREYPAVWDRSLATAFVPRLWAAENIRRLLGSAQEPEAVRGKVMSLGIEYGLMTPFTSFLALESEQAYQAMGVQRRYLPLRGLRLADLDRKPEAAPRRPLVQAASVGVGSRLGTGADAPDAVRARPAAARKSAPRESAAEDALEAEARLEAAPAPAEPPAAVASAPRGPVPGDAAALQPVPAAPDSRLAQALQVCSDTARRPLYERVLVWRKRVATAQTP
ncbi:MAG TPA: VIT and VWA domain-containing protein, partial [Myxococcota bacterium]|nr:VIT and VWA domain-containing protein [Myxococcota bacterium]